MSNRTKSGIFVVAVVALFFIISLAIGVASVDTAAMNLNAQPSEVIQDNASVTVIRETTSPKPFMGDTIREASLNWADYVETNTQAYELPESDVSGKPY